MEREQILVREVWERTGERTACSEGRRVRGARKNRDKINSNENELKGK